MSARRVFVDADACPVTREAIRVARSHRCKVVLVAIAQHSLERYTGCPGVEAVQVSSGRDSADFAIVERVRPGDVVVTQDIGLAAMALGRGAHALSVRGRLHTTTTIDAELAVRHAQARLRRAGGRHGGPPPFSDEDRARFVEALERLLASP